MYSDAWRKAIRRAGGAHCSAPPCLMQFSMFCSAGVRDGRKHAPLRAQDCVLPDVLDDNFKTGTPFGQAVLAPQRSRAPAPGRKTVFFKAFPYVALFKRIRGAPRGAQDPERLLFMLFAVVALVTLRGIYYYMNSTLERHENCAICRETPGRMSATSATERHAERHGKPHWARGFEHERHRAPR